MKNKKLILVMCCIFMFAQVSFAECKVGVVDIQELVNKAPSVQELKREHNSQIESLNSIVTEAQNAIAKECDPKKIVELQDKYNNEFNQRKDSIDKQYQAKLTILEESIRKDIEECAKNNCYNYVFAKGVILYGGEDITHLVSKDMK